jgi:hypothetical protein
MAELFDGRLENVGVREQHCEEATADEKCLTDGRNFLWVHCDDEGLVSELVSYFPNGSPHRILRAICDEFDVYIVDEHQPQFWGFETQEEWDAFQMALEEEDDQRFYNEVVKFVRGEEHDIRPGTVGETKAEIAKRLIAETPDLLAEEKRPDLIKAVNSIYDKDHAVVVRLTDEDIAFARMLWTHEDDLPQASKFDAQVRRRWPGPGSCH